MSAAEIIAEAEYFLQLLEGRTRKPIAIIDEKKVRGFRFGNPNVLNYVVINVARSLSILNAMGTLIQNGFQGEAMILARTLLETDSKLSYVVGGISVEGLDRKTNNFLTEFFADNSRDPEKRVRYTGVSQKDINRRNSEKVTRDIAILEHFGIAQNVKNEDDRYAKTLSHLYNMYSNHVHGRYPEMMDIYGEKTTNLRVGGSFESKDADTDLEIELLNKLAGITSKGFRTALMQLEIGNLIILSSDERHFCFGSLFST